jgi:hypothetical protein
MPRLASQLFYRPCECGRNIQIQKTNKAHTRKKYVKAAP